MKKAVIFLMGIIAAIGLTACGSKADADADAFQVNVICESEDVYQIFWSCYIGGEYYGMGGMANLDGKELTEESELSLTFTRDYFEGLADVTEFSIDFSPYGKDDTSEIATTDRVSIPAEYGKSYTVIFSGDADSGFKAELQ